MTLRAGSRRIDVATEIDWQERERILNREFVPEVLEMYRDSMQLSSKWKDEFATFWQLPTDFSI